MINVNNCLIINLDSRKDLWNYTEEFRKKWITLNKKVNRINGINLRDKKYNLNNFIISNRINLSARGFRKDKNSVLGEFGCYLAHYKCWEYVLNNKLESCLILEDGINLLRNDYENLKINSELDILFINKEMKKYNESKIEGFGLQGYIITLKGAKNLIDKCYILTLPIDLQIMMYCNNKILNFDVINNPFVERENNRISSICNKISDTIDLSEKQNTMHNFYQRIIINLINKNINLDDFI